MLQASNLHLDPNELSNVPRLRRIQSIFFVLSLPRPPTGRAAEQVMDLSEMNHQEMLFQTGNLHRRISHATRFVQSRNPPVHPTCRGAQDTDTSVARAASSHQSSNIFYPNMSSGCADGSIVAAPETDHRNVREGSVPAYPFHTDMKYSYTDVYNQACQSGTEPWQTPQMDIGYSTTEKSRENHRAWSIKAPQVGFTAALCMDNANAVAPSEAPNCQESDTSYYVPVLPCNQTQRYHDLPFHGGPEGYFHYGDLSSLALLPIHGAVSTVVPRDPSSSLRPTTSLVSCPSMGYDLVSDINAVAANVGAIGSKPEIGDTVSGQFMPMLNYYQTPAIQSLPLPPSEMTQHMPNGFDHPASSKASRNIGLELQQSVWDLKTGDWIPMRPRRSLSDTERAHGRKIRRSGGQCKKCKKGKRKVCTPLPTYCPVFH